MKAKKPNHSGAPLPKNWHTTTHKLIRVSSRFIYEATNHSRSRFYFEAIGEKGVCGLSTLVFVLDLVLTIRWTSLIVTKALEF